MRKMDDCVMEFKERVAEWFEDRCMEFATNLPLDLKERLLREAIADYYYEKLRTELRKAGKADTDRDLNYELEEQYLRENGGGETIGVV